MEIETRIVSSLEKVFCSPTLEGSPCKYLTALKGERVSFQIAVRADLAASFAVFPAEPEGFAGCISVREVKCIPSLMPAVPEDDYVLRKEAGLYPDALLPVEDEVALTAKNWHAVWISVDVPESIRPGKYTLKFGIKVTSRYIYCAWCKNPVMETEEAIELEVVNAVLPEQQLKVTHWFYADCIQHYYHVNAWSEEHWSLLEKYFRNFALHNNNMLLTPLWSVPLDMVPGKTARPVTQLLKIAFDGTNWSFDLTRLERWIITAQRCGIKCFEIVHAFSQWGLKFAPEIMVEQNGAERPMFGPATPFDAPEYAAFLRALMKVLLPCLRKHGLTPDNCYFHISDEPGEDALANYRYASELFREILEGYPVIEALSSIEFFRKGLIERPVPGEAVLDEFVKEKVAERWVYYAGEWRDGMPGRQFGVPSLRNRVLGILLYVYDCAGFLHWGYNFWFSQFCRTLDVDPWTDTNSGYCFVSGGAFLVYPGPDGPIDSLRHEVIAEGFRDEMALRLLESRTSREEVLRWLDEETGYRITLRDYPHSGSWLLELRNKLNRKLAELF